MDSDWQNNFHSIRERGRFILETQRWADCQFLVGTENNQKIVSGHKLILAMGSPVFERMFYGDLPEETNPIFIPDVQPDAFEAMLEYMYSDRISITSFDKACELCYVAKKYMLPHVVEQCTQFLWSDLSPKNACRAYEFAKLFDEPRLMQSSMEIIAANTREVIADSSFLDIEISTLMAILDQDKLNIDSELDLFNGLIRYATERGLFLESNSTACLSPQQQQQQQQETHHHHHHHHQEQPQQHLENPISPQIDVVGSLRQPDNISDGCVEEIKMEPDVSLMMHNQDAGEGSGIDIDQPIRIADDVVVVDSDTSGADTDGNDAHTSRSGSTVNNIMDAQRIVVDEALLRQAVKKIRFLTLTPQQFAEGPARSKLLQQNEALAILIKISSLSTNDCPMPEGFCSSRCTRNYYEPRCQREMLSSYRHSVPSNVPTLSVGASAQVDPHVSAPSIFLPVNTISYSESDIATNDTRRSYCVRTLNQQFDYRNTSVTDCGLTFQVDTNIWITGVQVPTQVLSGELMNSAGFSERYTEILYAHIQEMQGSRLTYTHCTSRVRYDSLLEISFDRPVYIYRNQTYKLFVVFNKVGWYPMYTCVPDVVCNRVKFMFNVGNPSESVRDGLIRAIVFSTPQEQSRSMIE